MPTSVSGTGSITLEPGCQSVVVVQARLHWNLDANQWQWYRLDYTGTWMPTSGSGTGSITLNLDANQW